MVYKPGTDFLWDGEWFNCLIVKDQDEADAALADGWVPHKPVTTDAGVPAEPARRGRPPKAKETVQ